MQRSPLSIAPVPSGVLGTGDLAPAWHGHADGGSEHNGSQSAHALTGALSAPTVIARVPHVPAAREFVYELKFLIGLEQSAALKHWVRTHLAPDPHGGGPHGDTYQVSSLYFDTRAFHVLGREGSYARSKYRIRRYNHDDTVYLERKVRGQSRVCKRRSATSIHSLMRLAAPQAAPDWDGHWFHRRVLARSLSAVSRVDYQRIARVVDSDYGPARLTLDQGLQAWHVRGLSFEPHGLGLTLPAQHLILELKYGTAMPLLFKQLISEFAPRLTGISKYRLACQHLGLTSSAPGPANGELLRRRAL
jgi:hypothetical protein